MAKPLNLTIELVYVSFPNLLPPTVYAKAISDLDHAETAHAEQVLKKAEQAVNDPQVKILQTRATGAPADVLADLAEADNVWGVVIGAKGHNAVSRVLLGSVADRLTHICSKPTVVVR